MMLTAPAVENVVEDAESYWGLDRTPKAFTWCDSLIAAVQDVDWCPAVRYELLVKICDSAAINGIKRLPKKYGAPVNNGHIFTVIRNVYGQNLAALLHKDGIFNCVDTQG